MGQCHRSVVIERNGWRVGVIGLIEYEWLETLSTVPVKQVRWVDYVVVARELAQHLRATEHVDLVVALTHMRIPNDERLAAEVPEVDLVLGGHDHDYYVNKVRRTWVIKSGTDFRDLSRITIPGGQKLAYDASTQWASREPLALDVDRHPRAGARSGSAAGRGVSPGPPVVAHGQGCWIAPPQPPSSSRAPLERRTAGRCAGYRRSLRWAWQLTALSRPRCHRFSAAWPSPWTPGSVRSAPSKPTCPTG